jgi:hypothetical protein
LVADALNRISEEDDVNTTAIKEAASVAFTGTQIEKSFLLDAHFLSSAATDTASFSWSLFANNQFTLDSDH